MKSTAAILVARDEPIVIDEIELGDPGPREVAVEVHATGVCGTQLLHMARTEAVPSLLGHEASGRVIAVGSEVTQCAEGDLVLISSTPTVRPGEAPLVDHPWTWRGRTQSNVDEMNVFTWATHTIVDERSLTRLSADIPLAEASVLGCAGITGCGSVVLDGEVGAGDSVAIWGVGGVGLFAVVAAAAVGARTIVAIDVDERALALAQRYGATTCLDPRTTDAVAAVHELTGGGADCAVDTVGACTVDAIRAVRSADPGRRRGGIAVLAQVNATPVTFDLRQAMLFGKTAIMSVVGGCLPQRDLPRFAEWFLDDRFPLDGLITRRFRLEEVNEACAALRSGETYGRSIIELV